MLKMICKKCKKVSYSASEDAKCICGGNCKVTSPEEVNEDKK